MSSSFDCARREALKEGETGGDGEEGKEKIKVCVGDKWDRTVHTVTRKDYEAAWGTLSSAKPLSFKEHNVTQSVCFARTLY